MSNLRNKVQLMGFVGQDPEVRTLPSGTKVANLSLATHDYYKNAKGEKVEETHWHNLVMWGKQAELAEKFIKKGIEIAVEGKLVTRNYEDKDGKKVYITEVSVSEFVFISKKTQETAEA